MSNLIICCDGLEKGEWAFDILGKKIDISTDDSTGKCLDGVLFCPFCGRRLEFVNATDTVTEEKDED
jgi:hypothetical protein